MSGFLKCLWKHLKNFTIWKWYFIDKSGEVFSFKLWEWDGTESLGGIVVSYVLLVLADDDRWVWSIGGVLMGRENCTLIKSLHVEACHKVPYLPKYRMTHPSQFYCLGNYLSRAY